MRTMIHPLCCGVAAVHLGGPRPTRHAASNKMPEEKPPKRRPGRPPSRTSHTAIDFHLTPKLHDAMKALAAERGVFLEDVYREAAEHFLERRAAEELGYSAPPHVRHATRVGVRMTETLRARMRAAAKEDHQDLGNAFETAVRLYLKLHGKAGP